MIISDLSEEGRAYAIGHPPSGRDVMRFLVRLRGANGVVTHGVLAEAFDNLDPNSKAKGWGHKVAPLQTLCGLEGLALSDLFPAYARPLCQACRDLDHEPGRGQ